MDRYTTSRVGMMAEEYDKSWVQTYFFGHGGFKFDDDLGSKVMSMDGDGSSLSK
jgi:hypothetical protein